jgi:hypothetical protein
VNKKDLIWGIGLSILSVCISIYSYGITSPKVVTTLARAEYYIRLWAYFLLILSTVLIGRTLLSAKKHDNTVFRNDSNNIIAPIFTSVCIIAYLFILKILGYFISTPLFLFILIYYFKKLSNKDEILSFKSRLIIIFNILFISVISSIISFYIFNNVLKVVLPRGII